LVGAKHCITVSFMYLELNVAVINHSLNGSHSSKQITLSF
jgi:hypothetical protein